MSQPQIPQWDDLILIGKITRTQGHRGAVRMVPEFEPLDAFEGLKGDELTLRFPAAPPGRPPAPGGASARPPGAPKFQIVHVAEFSYHQGCVILSLTEAPDMNAAELLRGAQVYVRPEDIWDLEEGEVFAHEIIGFSVVDQATERKIGQVRVVESGAAHDFLLVKKEGKPGEFAVPMVKAMVQQIDKEGRRILVTLPEGLEEL